MDLPKSKRALAAIKTCLFIACLIPFAKLSLGILLDTLGANPVEAITRGTGIWALNLLLATLSVSPLRIVTGAGRLLLLRRMLGLFAFFYATLHLSCFVVFDHFFDWAEIIRDIQKRPFVTVGFLSWLLLVPLAATSNRFSISRLGASRWQALHKTVYLIAILSCLHYLWLVKVVAILDPVAYSAIILFLLAFRVRPLGLRGAIPPPESKKPPTP